MSCENGDIGLGGSKTPENIFSGNEWDYKYIGSDDVLLLHRTLSFTDNGFILNELVNFWQKKSSTYTGTYSLSYDQSTTFKILTLQSNEPTLDGQVFYEYYATSGIPSMNIGEPSEAGDLVFFGKPFGSTVDLPRKLKKIN